MPAKQHYFACLDLDGRSCLVVGTGAMAQEKVEGLRAAGAEVTVVAPEDYGESHLDGMRLVVAATADEQVQRRVLADAEARNLFCNVADVPELCSFILPAIHRRGPIALAVSTGGASPALAKRLREKIAQIVRPEHAELAEELRAMRPDVKARFESYEERRDYFDEIVRERLS